MAISDIDPSTPSDNALAGEGDNEIRQLKSDIKEVFPALDGEITNTSGQGSNPPTSSDISSLFNRILSLEQNNTVTGSIVPGLIMIWNGSIATIPAGWTLCDGNDVNNVMVPDLTDSFVLGAGSTYSVGATGGYQNGSGTAAAGGHTHGGNTGDHAITVGELPTALANNIEISLSGGEQGDDHFKTDSVARGNTDENADYAAPMTATGLNGDGHDHSIELGGEHQHALEYPNFISLAYICYVGASQ